VAVAKAQLDKKEKVKCILERVEKASRQASHLCKHLTYFGKSEASFQKEDCHHITTLIEDLTEFILNGSNIKFRIDSPDDLWFIKIDESEFSVILTNLLLNAKQAMKSDGEINICLKNLTIQNHNRSLPRGDYVKISVKDNGTGITKQNLSKIFDPYFTTKQNGKGLGLLTTYSIIKKYDGYIDLETEPGVGTTFNIYFPAVQ
jgi:signal transduction histidine kinase